MQGLHSNQTQYWVPASRQTGLGCRGEGFSKEDELHIHAQLSGWLPAKGLALTLQLDVLGPFSLGSQVAQAKGH